MAVSRSFYSDWKRHPVTEELMQEIRSMMEDAISRMVMREEPDYDKDMAVRAFVKVADSVLNWQPEFLEGGQDA
jgi:BMFP domain-containing protein YqiC